MVPLFGKLRDRQHADFARSVRAGELRGWFPNPDEANKATDAASRAVDAVMRNVIGKPRAAEPAAGAAGRTRSPGSAPTRQAATHKLPKPPPSPESRAQ